MTKKSDDVEILAPIEEDVDSNMSEPENALEINPLETGITAIRQVDPDALIIYGVKGPKQLAGSTISAVLMNGEIVMLHQFASGKFGVFRKSAL